MNESATLSPATEARTELRAFLIADIRGYTRFTQERGNEAAAALVTRFAALTRDGVHRRGGEVIELRGDEAMAVFASARLALRAALDLQAAYRKASDEDPSLPMPVGIGIEAGEAVPLEDGYRGAAINLAARLCNLAGPGEILASEGVVYLGRRMNGVAYAMRGSVQIKGLADPTRIIKVVAAAEAGEIQVFPPVDDAALPIGGFLGALPNGVLVGREHEWERIMAVLETVMQGSGRLLLLAGEPGIGKTRLAQEVTLKARHWGFLVATGRCYEPEQAVPFYPFLDILATIYAASSAYVRAEAPRRWPHLRRLLPEEAELPLLALAEAPLRPPDRPEGEDQQRLFRAVTGFLTMAAEDMPLALLIDDVHWADASSLSLLHHLARSLRGQRVLLFGTYRDVELHRQHPLEATLLDLNRERLVDEVEIRRLDARGTENLLAAIMGEQDGLHDLAELIYLRTDGNAFFIYEMIQTLIERGDVYRQDGHWQRRAIAEMEVPKSIRSVIGQRLSVLDGRSQNILRQASVLGQEFTFDELRMLITPEGGLDATEDAIEHALEGAMASGLVREAAPDHYAFNHALTHQTLYAELSTRRRKRLHLAAGQALEVLAGQRSLGRRAAELAWHFLEGDDAARALPYALLAGDRAADVFANSDAERHYRTALDLARELNDRSHEIEALEKLADILTVVANYEAALELLERAVVLHQQSADLEGEACVVARIGHIYFLQDRHDEGIARLQPLVERLESSPPSFGRAALWAALARLYMDTGRYVDELDAADRAVSLAGQLDETPAVARLVIGAEVTRGDALWELNREDDTLRLIEELIRRAEVAADLDNLSRALSNAAMYYGWRGDLEKDRTYLERVLDIAQRRGDRRQLVVSYVALSQNAFTVGDWETARSYLDRAGTMLQDIRPAYPGTWPLVARSWLALRQGDLAAARDGARDIVSQDDPIHSRLALSLLGEADLLESPGRGSPQARSALDRLVPLREEKAARRDTTFLRTLAWACWEAGGCAGALELAGSAVEHARTRRAQPELIEALAMRGMINTGMDRREEAVQDCSEACALASALPMPFGEARALYEWGRLLLAAGEHEAARTKLDRASAIFSSLGARLEVERVKQALAAVIR